MKKVFIAGHNGMVGSALMRQLSSDTNTEIITRTRSELDLTSQSAVNEFFSGNDIDQVYLAAAKVGGIHANNTYPAEFIYENLMIQCNVINAAHVAGINKLLLLGSSCIYPRLAPQPMPEDCLLSGPLEPTNEPYAVAKIAGIKLCESYNRQYGTDFRSVMPTNLYGPGDNFHPDNSHVIPALMRRFHEAKINQQASVTVWGSGQARREFLHVNDMARACVHVMNLSSKDYQTNTTPMCSHINVGSGTDCTIAELTQLMAQVTGFTGTIEFDTSKPDGAPQKLLDVSRLASLGWQADQTLQKGLEDTYHWFNAQTAVLRT
jgi:GDP-L-fucose synthase